MTKYTDLLGAARCSAESGDMQAATRQAWEAAQLRPKDSAAWSLLGLLAASRGKHEEAIGHFRRATTCQPGVAAYWHNLGSACAAAGLAKEAVQSLERAIATRSDYLPPRVALGNLRRDAHDFDAAAAHYREALAIDPDFAPAHFAFANLLYSRGELPAAVRHYRAAIAAREEPAVRFRLAVALNELGHHQEAVDLFRQIESSQPHYNGLQRNLGVALLRLGHADEAVECYRKAITLNANDAAAYNNLGNALTSVGRPAEAIRCFRDALAVRPDYAKAHSNLLLNMNYVEERQERIYEEALAFGVQHRQVTTRDPAFPSIVRDPHKKLRIGYVSSDFRRHSVAYFALALIEAHDRNLCELVCYANVRRPDPITASFRNAVDQWVSIIGMDDASAAERVERDGIDILVDLNGHTSDNRLLLFARKPAPVQVSWLGYPNTVGLEAIDYRLTDEVADPEGESDRLHTERLLRLPDGFLCYRPDDQSPAVGENPAADGTNLIFGSFNALAKITAETVETWAEILHAICGSRLRLKAYSLGSGSARDRLMAMFAKQGIAPDRIDLLAPLSDKAAHLQAYSEIDIALDTFPYNGTTTTCEALWMGVPVIVLRGQRHASRVGASLLETVGLPELVAPSRAGYVTLARSLAGDHDRRAALRRTLREQMLASPLMDSTRFARSIESAFRQMWISWCAQSVRESG